MHIMVVGGSGFVGRILNRRLSRSGHALTVLSRSSKAREHLPEGVSICLGDPTRPGAWQNEAAVHEVLINLAGAPIFGRWTKSQKELIRNSRIQTTRNLVEALSKYQGDEAPVLINASAIGYYGFHGDEELNEASPPGDDFLARVCQDWEAEALKAKEHGGRVIRARFGVILGPDGGALTQMLSIFKKGLGGRLGSGKQWFSWIHINDLIDAFNFFLARPSETGAFNLTAPHPVTNSELTRVLAEVLERPAFLPAPAFAVKLLMGEMGSVLLKGQKVLPKALLDAGFKFKYARLPEALQDLLT
jgi:uncharacterized protein (TIGR01777 family)